jgi:hypothetical protein
MLTHNALEIVHTRAPAQMHTQVLMIDHTDVQGQSASYVESLMQGEDNSIVIVSGTHNCTKHHGVGSPMLGDDSS